VSLLVLSKALSGLALSVGKGRSIRLDLEALLEKTCESANTEGGRFRSVASDEEAHANASWARLMTSLPLSDADPVFASDSFLVLMCFAFFASLAWETGNRSWSWNSYLICWGNSVSGVFRWGGGTCMYLVGSYLVYINTNLSLRRCLLRLPTWESECYWFMRVSDGTQTWGSLPNEDAIGSEPGKFEVWEPEN